MLFPDFYKREEPDRDDGLFQARVTRDAGIRVCTDASSTSSRPSWLTIKQARAAREALDEAIFAAELIREIRGY